MPEKRAKAERLLEDALAALARALDDAGAPWMVIGGIAIIAHGVRRFTTDIDAAVRGDAISIDQLLEALARHDIVPRIPDAAAFAQANLVLLARHAPTGVDLDVSQAWSSFEHEALAARERARLAAEINRCVVCFSPTLQLTAEPISLRTPSAHTSDLCTNSHSERTIDADVLKRFAT